MLNKQINVMWGAGALLVLFAFFAQSEGFLIAGSILLGAATIASAIRPA
jgi:hypothetical protein